MPPRQRTAARRKEAVRLIRDQKLSYLEAAERLGVSKESVRKWWLRYEADGMKGLEDSESRRGRHLKVTDEQATRIMRHAWAEGATTLEAIVAIAGRLGIKVGATSMRRRLVADGMWPLPRR